MKKCLLFTGAVFFIISGSALNAETAPGGKSILDYYLQIPDKYLQCETEDILQKKDKLALIKKKNLKKGYIQASTADGNFPVEIALFTDDQMGIKILALNVRCHSGCMCRKLEFFFISEGKLMKKDEGHIFPKDEDIEKAAGVSGGYEFILSEGGRSIKVAEEESGKTLLVVEWSGGMFYVR